MWIAQSIHTEQVMNAIGIGGRSDPRGQCPGAQSQQGLSGCYPIC